MTDLKYAGKRVLIVIRQFFPLAAGAETQALRQAKSYIEMGCAARVVTARHDASLPREDVIEGVPVTRLGAPRARFFGSLVFLWRLGAYLIGRRREYDAVLVFHLKQAAAVTALVSACLGKRVVISAQAAGALGDVTILKRTMFGWFILWASKKARAFISGASEITDDLTRVRVPKHKIHFIPNGIPIEAFRDLEPKNAARAALGIPANAFVVLNVGRHTAQKDLKTLLSAWRTFAPNHSNALLVLVGDGDEHEQLKAFVARNALGGSVRFEGWQSNVRRYLAAADVFASSSIFEGTHIALGEAMAAGLPVVATPVGGSRDFIRDGESGLHFPLKDAEALSSALGRLAADNGLRARLGKAAARAADDFLAQEKTARLHLDVLFGSLALPRTARRIRVTHVIATLDRAGTEHQLAELAARIDRNSFDTEVICLTRGGPTADLLDAASIPYRVIGKKAKFDLFPLFWMTRRFMLSPPDVLQTWLFTSNLFGRLAGILAGVGPLVACERSTDPWKPPVHRAADRLLALGTRCIVANSAAVMSSLSAWGIPAKRVRIIPNGVDTDEFHPMESRDARFVLALPPDGPCFGFIGRLAFEKRPEVFVKVAKVVLANVPGARALVFGDGPMADDLKSQTWRLKDRLTFCGDTPFAALAHASLDCLVLTSQWEGFPNVVLEAMACGRPVVAVKMPATEELIVNGETGLVVDDNVDALASAVTGLLRDPARAAEMGRRGRLRAEEFYSMDKMVKAYEALYREVLRRPAAGGGNR